MGLEIAFRALFGTRRGGLGGLIDADTFRDGRPKDWGKLLKKTGEHLEKRFGALRYADWEEGAGQPRARLGVVVDQLKRTGDSLAKIKANDDEVPAMADHLWDVVGALLMAVASLLDHLEGSTKDIA